MINNGQSYCQQVEKRMICDLEARVFKKPSCLHVQTGLLSSNHKRYLVKITKKQNKGKNIKRLLHHDYAL